MRLLLAIKLKKIMYRFYLTFLFVFLISYFATNAQVNDLILEKVSVDTLSQKVTLTWLYHNDADSVKIFKCTNYCDNPPNAEYIGIAKIKMDQSNLEWVDNSANSIHRNDYRIAWGFSSWTAPQNNMVLEATHPENLCPNSVLLSWNPYINMFGTLDWYKILYRKKGADMGFMLFDSIKGTHFTNNNSTNIIHYEVKYLDNNTIYEFVLQAVNSNNSVHSYSNIVEYETQFVNNAPVLMEISRVSVIDDTYIEIGVEVTNSVPFDTLYLLRDKPIKEFWNKDSLSFKKIDSKEYNPNNRKYNFKDENVNPSTGLYYYTALASHKCRFSDTSSNIQTNIFLYGARVEKYGDSIYPARVKIYFNDVWDETEESHELVRIVYGEKRSIINALTLNRRHYIDIKRFIDDGAVMVYQVKSDNDCYSNTITIEHEPLILFPNAFYPEGLNLEDKTFYPILKFPSEENYLFVIYNRWGQEVYRSTLPPIYGNYVNMQGRWDGTFQGKDCPPGIYAYQISYTFNEGTGKYSTTGSFMLVR